MVGVGTVRLLVSWRPDKLARTLNKKQINMKGNNHSSRCLVVVMVVKGGREEGHRICRRQLCKVSEGKSPLRPKPA